MLYDIISHGIIFRFYVIYGYFCDDYEGYDQEQIPHFPDILLCLALFDF